MSTQSSSNVPTSSGKRPTLASTLKSRDTEEAFDLIFYRPIGYVWALLCRRLGIVPNAVTLVAIVVGTAGGILFAVGSLTCTLWAIGLLVFANSLRQCRRTTGPHDRPIFATRTLSRRHVRRHLVCRHIRVGSLSAVAARGVEPLCLATGRRSRILPCEASRPGRLLPQLSPLHLER